MNIQKLMQQAKKMQKDLEIQQNKLKEKTYSDTISGIKITINGNYDILELEIDDTLLNKDAKEDLQDMLQHVLGKLIAEAKAEQDKLLNNLQMPGLF